MATTQYTAPALFWRLLRQARPYWPHIAGIFLIDLLSTPLTLLKPVALKIVVDCVVGSNPLPNFLKTLVPDSIAHSAGRVLILAAILQVLVVLLIQMQELAHHMLSTYSGEALTLAFRARLFRHLQRLSVSFHDTRGTADSIYRVEHDAPSIQWITVHGLMPFLSAGVMVLGMIYVTARLNWQLALVGLGVAPLLAIFVGSYDRCMEGRYGQVSKIESSALKVVQETLGAIRVVKAFGREEGENERFVRYSSTGLRAHVRLAFGEGIFGLLVNLTTATGTALVLYLGIRSVLAGSLTLGELLMVMAYLMELYGPLETISVQIATLQGSMTGARRALELLDEAPEVVERPHALPLQRAKGAVEFRKVSFAYEEPHLILRDVSVVIPAGTRVGIAGRTGVGKTTLVSLLNRFYDPTSGQILLDGIDLRDYRLADLRRQFALVLQEPVLFSTTISENIAYARPGAGEHEIIAAAKAANAHDFIIQLPKGYQTQVGERGMRVSGGERQRISLARAFLKDAPILILDEPTSSIDTKTEAVIVEAMERLMSDRTAFFISHRLNTLKGCDVMFFLEDGRSMDTPADPAAAAGGVMIDPGGGLKAAEASGTLNSPMA